MACFVQVPAETRRLLAEPKLRIVLMGAGGWISQAVLDVLTGILDETAMRERVHVFGSTARQMILGDGRVVEVKALAKWREVPPDGPAIVFHNSFLTRDKVADLPANEYIARNRHISAEVLAFVKSWDVCGIVLPSSGAAVAPSGGPERDLAQNPYGALKVADEESFGALAEQLGIALAVPRIYGLSGEYINKPEFYALASFIESARRGMPIHIRARHRVLRSYVYVGDLIGLCLAIATDIDRPRVVFDTAGETTVEIGDLATMVLDVTGRSELGIERDLDASLAPDRYVGDRAAIDRLWQHHRIDPLDLRAQVERTARFLYATAGAVGR